jgi:F-type H+-transporting ATPase subunit epsilon
VTAKYHFKILTPIEKKLDEDVVSIVAPGESGYLGVLANHAPLITTLRAGNLKVSYEGKPDKLYRIGGGILKVLRNEVVLLTETIEEESSEQQ